MRVIRSVVVAFAMFSRIPMPAVEWDRESLRYAILFLPLVGLAVGGGVYLFSLFLDFLAFGAVAKGVTIAVIPLFLTGGVHLDGFADTVDALASRADREKKLAILKDPHIGSFAAMFLSAYLLCFAALASETHADREAAAMVPWLFVLSRCLCGFMATTVRPAREDGLGRLFHDASARTRCLLGLSCCLVAVLLFLCRIDPAAAALTTMFAFASFYLCRRSATANFGGVTGDVSGYFLQICELAGLAGLVLARKLAPFL